VHLVDDQKVAQQASRAHMSVFHCDGAKQRLIDRADRTSATGRP
jgi:hypothetical protein